MKNPVITISRSKNGFFFSGYQPNTTVKDLFKFPQGAPLLLGLDTQLDAGQSAYTMPTAWSRECRVFVEQESGLVGCKEMHSGEVNISRRMEINGLKDAKVRIYPPTDITEDQFHAYVNAQYPWRKGAIAFKKGDPSFGFHYEIEEVNGTLVVSW